jgi:hypothetical protein
VALDHRLPRQGRRQPEEGDGLIVIAGLDPAIHPSSKMNFSMDARVEPAHDVPIKPVPLF